MSDDGFNEHRRLILSGIEALQHNVESVAKEQARANTATESAFAKLVTRTDAIDVWRSEHEKQRREDRTDVDKRLRELENTRRTLRRDYERLRARSRRHHARDGL